MTPEEAAAVALAIVQLALDDEEGSTINVDPYRKWREVARLEALQMDADAL